MNYIKTPNYYINLDNINYINDGVVTQGGKSYSEVRIKYNNGGSSELTGKDREVFLKELDLRLEK